MIRAIIIDDEHFGRQSLKNALAKYCSAVEVVDVCESPERGIASIKLNKPDLVFLDIQMPTMTGFDLLQQLTPISFEIIFVTSYDQYAVKAFKFSALDYLLKPINPDELKQAVNKIESRNSAVSIKNRFESLLNNLHFKAGKIERLAIPTSGGIDFFNTDDIIYCQAEGSYTTLFMINNKKEIVSKTLKEFDNLLHASGFCRVHNSTLINLKHVKKYLKGEGGYVILTEGHHADISRRKKEEFLNMLDKI
ncbi:MAG TPA: LytTR family DNA-binding domain-containing protein [Cyclobacteriaceae bacterium]|nr:LytTR family DNA-binding domain-containing protein [Cyclobacteriaceae bacterium]